MDWFFSDSQKIGIMFLFFSLFFATMGVLLFFDTGLLAVANLVFVPGFTLVLGADRTFYFFTKRENIRASLCFVFGLILVFVGRPFFGFFVEGFGFVNLFGNFFPLVFQFIKGLFSYGWSYVS